MRNIYLKILHTLIYFCMGAFIVNASAQTESLQNILIASDAIRNPQISFESKIEIFEYKNKSLIQHMIFEGKSQYVSSEKNYFRTILKTIFPKKDYGKIIFRNSNELWFYDPNSKDAIRIAPQQRLIAQASNGDVITTNFSSDYKVIESKNVIIEDGTGKARESFKLNLVSINTLSTYQNVVLYLDRLSLAPILAEFSGASEQVIKKAYYLDYQFILGTSRPSKIAIIDGLDSSLITLIKFSNIQSKDFPNYIFQKDYLNKLSN